MIDKHSPEYTDDTFIADRKREIKTKESRISYKKPENKYAEVWDYSLRTAVKIVQNPNSGEQMRTSYIGSHGASSMKVRKIEKKIAIDTEWKMYLTKAYDDKGNLIREIDGEGNLKEFVYDKDGKHWKTLKNGNLNFMAYNNDPTSNLFFIEKDANNNVSLIQKDGDIIVIKKLENDKVTSNFSYDKNNGFLHINSISIPIKITKTERE